MVGNVLNQIIPCYQVGLPTVILCSQPPPHQGALSLALSPVIFSQPTAVAQRSVSRFYVRDVSWSNPGELQASNKWYRFARGTTVRKTQYLGIN